jgi:hypothetical protein
MTSATCSLANRGGLIRALYEIKMEVPMTGF